MNEQSSKKIFFNKSTLLSLKAELLKKQEEVYEKKQLPQHRLENFKPSHIKPENNEKNANEEKKTFKDSLKAIDTEELEACRKAKAALEKKAELYKHLSDGAGTSEFASRFLVDFNTKKHQIATEPSQQELTPSEDHETHYNDDDDSEWAEFTDCLGRTRKCLKSDLQFYKDKDRDLRAVMNKDKTDELTEGTSNEADVPKAETPLLVQKTNDYLQSLREKWEQKEKELLAKDKDLHYQDLLFDEARMHGVAYFSFSTDETERRKQMEDLVNRREETLRAQQEANEKRKQMDDLMAARVAAARARQRARAGLPPEDPKDKEKDFTTRLLEFLTQQKNEADSKALEEEKKKREEQEKERQKLRDAYVREWDIGKEGVEGKVKKFREMTQEEYVEQQRAKRIEEFAPPVASGSKYDYSFSDSGEWTKTGDEDSIPKQKSWSDVRPARKTPPPPDIGDLTKQKGLYFTSKKVDSGIKYKNFVKTQEPTPIVNELDDDECVIEESKSQKRNNNSCSDHAEIAPPLTYDYYGPVPKKHKADKPFESDIREAYDQGAKSLEPKASHLHLSKHYDFTFD